MIYFFQSLSLKTRFLALVLLTFPVLAFQWLLSAPWALASLKAHGGGLPDTGFWYDAAFLKALETAWGPDGRALYLAVLWPTDLGFLLSYGALLTAAVLYLLKKINPSSPWYLLPLLPLASAFFDLWENLWVALSVLVFPGAWDIVAWLAALGTAGKWVFAAATGAVLVLGTFGSLVAGTWKKVRAAGREE